MPLSTHARLGSFFELCNFYFYRCQIAFSMKDKMSRSKRASGTQSRQDAEQSKKNEVGLCRFLHFERYCEVFTSTCRILYAALGQLNQSGVDIQYPILLLSFDRVSIAQSSELSERPRFWFGTVTKHFVLLGDLAFFEHLIRCFQRC